MKTTLSIIKADIGSVGGHIAPSRTLFSIVKDYVKDTSPGLVDDTFISSTGDDIALLMCHQRGVLEETGLFRRSHAPLL